MKRVRNRPRECTGCEACALRCPAGAIQMRPDAEGFAYPVIDQTLCTDCGLCRRICPVDHATPRPWAAAYAAYAKDDALRGESSSGGLFSLLARRTLEAGGPVFGAAVAGDGPVHHARAQNETELAALRGSKYAQSSELAAAYAQVRETLRAGKPALFSGTPCQVAGLYAALGSTPREGLLTTDLVCHGVPSPRVYAAYLREMARQRGVRVQRVNFRDKARGWKDFNMRLDFADGTTYRADQRTDPYMIAFLKNYCLRPSCHRCPFAGERRQADVTLVDCWGAARIAPEMDDDRGLSLALIGSPGGEAAWDQVQSQLRAKPVEARDTLKENACLLYPVRPNKKRAAFMRHVERNGFVEVQQFFKPPGWLSRTLTKGRKAVWLEIRKLKRRIFNRK